MIYFSFVSFGFETTSFVARQPPARGCVGSRTRTWDVGSTLTSPDSSMPWAHFFPIGHLMPFLWQLARHRFASGSVDRVTRARGTHRPRPPLRVRRTRRANPRERASRRCVDRREVSTRRTFSSSPVWLCVGVGMKEHGARRMAHRSQRRSTRSITKLFRGASDARVSGHLTNTFTLLSTAWGGHSRQGSVSCMC